MHTLQLGIVKMVLFGAKARGFFSLGTGAVKSNRCCKGISLYTQLKANCTENRPVQLTASCVLFYGGSEGKA